MGIFRMRNSDQMKGIKNSKKNGITAEAEDPTL
jgi:hypothetical protein